jgi:hypothetical protein
VTARYTKLFGQNQESTASREQCELHSTSAVDDKSHKPKLGKFTFPISVYQAQARFECALINQQLWTSAAMWS